MTTEKIVKIAKGLGRFHLDEICIISELSEDVVLKELENLVQEQVLRKAGNTRFQYIGKIIMRNRKELQNHQNHYHQKEDLSQIPFTPKEININIDGLQAYPEWAKKKAIKYLKVIEASKGLYGKKLQLFLKQWNQEYPEMKVGYSSLMREKKKLVKEGVTGLVAHYGRQKIRSSLTDEMYTQFRDLYLSHQRRSAISCQQVVKDNNKVVDPFPSHQSFMRRLKMDFTKKEIQTYRTF